MEMSIPEGYVRYVTPDFEYFDPVELAKETEKIVCRDDQRKYTGFNLWRYYGGTIDGYTCGCCLRCVFCWADWSRDFPERAGHFYTPERAFERIISLAKKYGVNRVRITGAEPTIGKKHLLRLLELFENSDISVFILETNGVLFGVDKRYVKQISKFEKHHVRISLKAGFPEEFAKKTGALPESFEIPFQAIRNLLDCNVDFHVAAVTDPRIMSFKERANLIRKLKEIDPNLIKTLEEEVLEPHQTALVRLKYAGFRRWHYLLPFRMIDFVRSLPSEGFRQRLKRILYRTTLPK